MRVKVVFLIAALLLGGGAAYVWNTSEFAAGDWVQPGRAATRASVPRISGDKTSPEAATLQHFSAPVDRSKGSGVTRVVVTPARKGEVPIYLSGIGTVQAYYTVNIKSQVDGVILKMPFDEGQDAKAGDPVVIIDPTTYQAKLEQAQALKARATVQLENAKTNLWRDEELLKHSFATQKQTDQERMLVGQYTAEIAQYDADIKFAQAQLDYATIRSPINGRIGIRAVDPGNLVRGGENITLVTIVQLQPISVIITVAAKELARHDISLGLTSLPVAAYSENGVTPLGRGEVRTVNNTVQQTTGTIQLKASFANEQYKLWPGDFVDCKIMVDKRNDGLTVPTAAVHAGPKGDFVWLITPDNTAAIRPVRVRQSIGGTSLIEGNVQAGDSIVLDGYQRLLVGSRVEIAPEGTDVGSKMSSTE
jgi:multidrug efflux system membrane fusion protein